MAPGWGTSSSSTISVLSYGKSSLAGKKFFPQFSSSFVREFQIFFLSETHVTEDGCLRYDGVVPKNRLFKIGARERATFGRANGGIFCGILKNKWLDKYVHVVTCVILSTYYNPSSWLQDFDGLEDGLLENCGQDFIVCGDLNGRIESY